MAEQFVLVFMRREITAIHRKQSSCSSKAEVKRQISERRLPQILPRYHSKSYKQTRSGATVSRQAVFCIRY